jgi:hypothetical protein
MIEGTPARGNSLGCTRGHAGGQQEAVPSEVSATTFGAATALIDHEDMGNWPGVTDCTVIVQGTPAGDLAPSHLRRGRS